MELFLIENQGQFKQTKKIIDRKMATKHFFFDLNEIQFKVGKRHLLLLFCFLYLFLKTDWSSFVQKNFTFKYSIYNWIKSGRLQLKSRFNCIFRFKSSILFWKVHTANLKPNQKYFCYNLFLWNLNQSNIHFFKNVLNFATRAVFPKI